MAPEADLRPNEPVGFQTTHWTAVLSAQQSDSPASARALEALCRTYWPPVYAFIRRKGHDPHTAEDLTQGFFEKLLQKDYLHAANRAEGRFRTFLLTAVTRFLANEWDRTQAQKRGGGLQFISLQDESDEERYLREPSHELSPERLYERRWVEVMLASVLERLHMDYMKNGQAERFEVLKVFLLDGGAAPAYAEVAQRLGIGEVAARSAVFRMRQLYGACLRAEIAQTVASPSEVEDEVRYLLSVLAGT